eukprot:gene10325-biopygen9329
MSARPCCWRRGVSGEEPLAETLVGKLRLVHRANDALSLPITPLFERPACQNGKSALVCVVHPLRRASDKKNGRVCAHGRRRPAFLPGRVDHRGEGRHREVAGLRQGLQIAWIQLAEVKVREGTRSEVKRSAGRKACQYYIGAGHATLSTKRSRDPGYARPSMPLTVVIPVPTKKG